MNILDPLSVPNRKPSLYDNNMRNFCSFLTQRSVVRFLFLVSLYDYEFFGNVVYDSKEHIDWLREAYDD